MAEQLPEFGEGRETLPEQAPTEAMLEAIEWAVAENAREGSVLEGKLAADRIAVAGHSCGGLQAIASGADSRVNTMPIGHCGTWREPAGGRMTEILVAWLGWQLKDEESAAAMFIREPCGLCGGADWAVKRKNWPVAE